MNLPFLDLASPDFSTRSDAVYDAREAAWAARTPYGICVLRHREAGLLLRDKRLRQGSYSWTQRNGLDGPFGQFWERSIISQEGDAHKTLRAIMVPALSEHYIETLRPEFVQSAKRLVKPFKDKSECEFIAEFTMPFAGQAICALLGLPYSNWPHIAQNAADLGLAMGVNCQQDAPIFDAACENLTNLAAELVNRVENGQDTTSFVARLIYRCQRNKISKAALLDMIVIAIFGGVDTTKAQLGFLIGLLIENPNQWGAIKQDQSLIPNAISEAIRNRPTTTWATREATQDFEFQDLLISKGTTVHILSHASSTDPRVEPDQSFDVSKRRKSHFGFGGGAHHCIGHLMARTDMADAMGVLLDTVKSFAFNGTAEYSPDSGNTTPIIMPLRYELET